MVHLFASMRAAALVRERCYHPGLIWRKRQNDQAVLAILHLSGVAQAAADYNAIFEDAVRAIDSEFMQSWSYTETSVEAEATLVGGYDPRQPSGERWVLLSVDGREPTAAEIEDYEDDKANDNGDEDDNSVTTMVDSGSLELLEETDDHYLFSFIPSDDEKDFLEHLDATVKIIKSGPYIEYIDMDNRKPFRPRIGVKISNFATRLRFGPAAEGGPIVPISIDVRIKMRAFLIINVDEKVSISYSDYEFVGH